MKIVILLSLFAIIFSITSCSVLDRKPKITYNGDELSLADITEMRDSFNEETLN